MLKRLSLALFLTAALGHVAQALLPFGHGGASSSGGGGGTDQMAALLAQSSFTAGTWADAGSFGSFTSPAPTLNTAGVGWNCPTSPTTCESGADATTVAGSDGLRAVMGAWSGGAVDFTNGQLIVTGGGHTNYFGQSLYAFVFKNLAWTRLTPTHSITGYGGTGTLPNSTPANAPAYTHTYGEIVTLPSGVGSGNANGKFIFAGLAGCATNGNSCNNVPEFDLGTLAFSYLATCPNCAGGGAGSQITVYNPNDGNIYNTVPGGGVNKYVVSTDTWSQLNNNNPPDYHQFGDLDPSTNEIWGAGNGFLFKASLTTGNITTLSPTGATSCIAPPYVGIRWDSITSDFIIWPGGKTICHLNPSTLVITSTTPGSGATPTCGDSVGAGDGQCSSSTGYQNDGTYGRFFCMMPTYNACGVVNSTNADVFIYKHP